VASAIIGPLAGNFIAARAIIPFVNLSLSKSAPTTVAPGGTLTYTLTLTNKGPIDAHDIHLSDLLPAGLTAFTTPTFTIAPTPTAALPPDCSTSTKTAVSCTIDNLIVNGTVTITFSASVSTTATGTITNTATAVSTTTPANVSATAKTTIAKPQVLFVLLQGINTSLSDKDVMKNGGLGEIPDFVNEARFGRLGSIHVPGIVPFLKAHGYSSAQFLAYSYLASYPSNGHPFSYSCIDTFTNTLQQDALTLSIQIDNFLKTQPKGTMTDIYLIGHSLGGAVALT
jgi:uncharacterized repeat protein (TIGR01451 family)